MENLRCQCGKIVCQLDQNLVVIKCRHCKRMIIINTKGLITSDDGKLQLEYK
ncbi:MAG: hypothetical protein ACYC2T_06860 [Bacillota bacterium]